MCNDARYFFLCVYVLLRCPNLLMLFSFQWYFLSCAEPKALSLSCMLLSLKLESTEAFTLKAQFQSCAEDQDQARMFSSHFNG